MLEFRYIKKHYWQTFVLCALLAMLLFLPICLRDGMDGTFFHYAGDYNAQQILFWQYGNNFVKQGGSFSWQTDLGSGFINAYSFYILGSPFYWLSLLVPSHLMPWAMVPLLCLKFAIAGSGAYLWTKRWIQNPQYAMLAGILYAFSGYSVYSIFYNHFLDIVALFPYLLAALDNAMLDNRRGEFPFWVALNLLVNYYFFLGEAIFLIIYFMCMLLGGKYKVTRRSFFRMAFETILGCTMGCVLLMPAAMSIARNPRSSDFLNDYGFICYSQPQKYMAILCSMFLMPDAPYSTVLFPESVTRWQNLSAYLPVVGIAGGLALNRANRKHPFSRLLRFSVLCAFVPMLNAMFTLENASYYARWFYMPILILSATTGMVLENEETCNAQWKDAWKTVLLFTLGFAAIGLVPSTVGLFGTKLGVATSSLIFWLIWGVSIAGVLLGGYVFKKYYGTEKFISAMTCIVMVFCFVYGEAHIMLTRYTSQVQDDGHGWFEGYQDMENVAALLPQETFYRMDTLEGDNYGLVLNKSSESFFNSTVSPGIFSFYNGVGMTRDVRSTIAQKYYSLRSLLGARFLLVNAKNENVWNAESVSGGETVITESNVADAAEILTDNDTSTITYTPAEWADNWAEYARTNEFIIYENQNYIPMGFTYDYYITQTQYAETDPAIRSNLLLKALVLTDEQVEKYGDLLQPLPESEFDNCTYSAFEQDCAQRRQHTADTFEANNYGFTASTNFDTDELVFFSVPYEKNAFTATVNGQPTEVAEVDCGLMAIRVPAGQADISVTYHTPGLRLSVTISLAAAAVWVIYMAYVYRDDKRKKAAQPVPTTETAA